MFVVFFCHVDQNCYVWKEQLLTYARLKKKKNQGKKHLFHPRSGHENRKTNFSSASCGDIVGVMMQTNFTFLENKKRGGSTVVYTVAS